LIELIGPSGAVLSLDRRKYGVCHGHAWPGPELASASLLLTAHNHPLVELRDSLGFTWSERAWVLGKVKYDGLAQDSIVFPAFNTLSGGLAFNSRASNQLLGPLFENNCFDLENAEIRLLSGMPLGKVKTLRKHAEYKH
jgi:metallophosphoesterase superfamily enzyme